MGDAETETSAEFIESCPSCGQQVDVSEQGAFSMVNCPTCGEAMRVRTQFNQFQAQDVLGQGGMGAVYKALDTQLNRPVALKVLRPDLGDTAEEREKLEREAQLTASITHPHVVKVYSCGIANEQFYIAMELVDGGSLDDLLQQRGRVPEAQALMIGSQVAQGLLAAHKKNLMHSDLKPGNILFADPRTAKIVDFGLAVVMMEEAYQRGEVWGTPYYVSPERLNKDTEDFRSDIYSLGATLFHALAGRPPFEDETASLVALKHLRSRAVSLQSFAPDVSSETAYVVNQMLQKDREERYGSYEELIQHLEYARSKVEEAAKHPQQEKARVVVESKQSTALAGWLTLGLLIFLIGLGVFLFMNWEKISGTEKVDAEETVEEQRAGNWLEQIRAARELMIRGDVPSAGARLADLAEKELPQPERNWVTLHRAIAAKLMGNVDGASQFYRQLAQRELFAREGPQLKLANFFSAVGEQLSEPQPVSPRAARLYAANNAELLAYFLFGLQNWQLGEFDDAAQVFRRFVKQEPPVEFEWYAEFKPLAQRYLEDYTLYKNLPELGENPTDARRRDYLEKLREARQELKMEGRLKEMLDEQERELSREAAANTAAPGAA